MLSIEPRQSDQGYNIWHAMTHAFRAPGSPRFAFGFGALAVLVMMVAYIVVGIIFALIFGGAMSALVSGDFTGFGGGAILLLIVGYILFLVFALFLNAIVEAGMHRRMLGQQSGGFPFRVGQDEKNLFICYLGVYGLFFIVYFLGAIVIGLIAALLGQVSPILASIPLIIFGVLLAMLMVKLAPAGALTTLNKKPHVLAALQVSKHRSWSIFFTYLLMMIFFYIVGFAIAIVSIGPAAFMGMFTGDPTALAGAMGGGGILFFVLLMAFYILSIPMFMGIGSYIVKHWAGGDLHQANVFE